MRQERHAGYEVKALSNLIRRKVWELSGQPECDALPMQDASGISVP